VLEDEPALQETLNYNLKHQGFVILVAGDGQAALDSARELKPDLIVLDIMFQSWMDSRYAEFFARR